MACLFSVPALHALRHSLQVASSELSTACLVSWPSAGGAPADCGTTAEGGEITVPCKPEPCSVELVYMLRVATCVIWPSAKLLPRGCLVIPAASTLQRLFSVLLFLCAMQTPLCTRAMPAHDARSTALHCTALIGNLSRHGEQPWQESIQHQALASNVPASLQKHPI